MKTGPNRSFAQVHTSRLAILCMFKWITIAFFMVAKARAKLCRQRNADFQARYLPQFRQYLEQCSSALQKRFQTSGTG